MLPSRRLSGESQLKRIMLDGNSNPITPCYFYFVLESSDMTMPDENLIYDIGMHRGEDTDFYLRKGFNVIGFEANPHLVAQCRIRFQDAVATGRLRIVEGAIATEEAGDSITFYINAESAWGTVHPSWGQNATLLSEKRAKK
jgi:hypothetical protein